MTRKCDKVECAASICLQKRSHWNVRQVLTGTCVFLSIGIPITDSHFWQNEEECTLDVLRQVFRSCTDEEIPLLKERLACLREAGNVLYQVRHTTPPSHSAQTIRTHPSIPPPCVEVRM